MEGQGRVSEVVALSGAPKTRRSCLCRAGERTLETEEKPKSKVLRKNFTCLWNRKEASVLDCATRGRSLQRREQGQII